MARNSPSGLSVRRRRSFVRLCAILCLLLLVCVAFYWIERCMYCYCWWLFRSPTFTAMMSYTRVSWIIAGGDSRLEDVLAINQDIRSDLQTEKQFNCFVYHTASSGYSCVGSAYFCSICQIMYTVLTSDARCETKVTVGTAVILSQALGSFNVFINV